MDTRPRVYWHASNGTPNRIQHVKNLGWLTRNAAHVTLIGRSLLADDAARVWAEGTRNGTQFVYIADFASARLARLFCNRPRFAHAVQEVR